jgi:hypothetical protein
MSAQNLDNIRKPIIRIDKSLDKYDHVVLFPLLLHKANEMLRLVGLPKVNRGQEGTS